MHPLKLYIMGFFDGAGVGLLSSLGGVAGSLAGGALDYRNQKKLMERQQEYNRENATTAYNRQRELTQDQAYLSQLGKMKAGINTAFGTDGNVTSSANVDQASPVSIPSPMGLGQQLSTSLRSFMQDSLVNAQRKNVESDTTAKNIDNATRAMENALKIKKLNQDIGVGMLNYAKDAFKFAVDKQYYDRQQSAKTDEMEQNAKRAEALQQIEAINAKFAEAKTEADINILKQQFENLKKVYDLTDAQIVTEKGKPRVQLSEVRKNNASANQSNTAAALNEENKNKVHEETEGIKKDNEYKQKSMYDRLALAAFEAQKAKLATLPKDYKDIIMRSSTWQLISNKLANNLPLDERENELLDWLLELDKYDPQRDKDRLMHIVSILRNKQRLFSLFIYEENFVPFVNNIFNIVNF